MITYAETRAAFAKAARMALIGQDQLVQAKRDFETIWKSLGVLLPDEPMIRRAGELAEIHGLRGYDSVHLAAAESVWLRASDATQFLTADRRLRDAGNALGIESV